MSKKILFIEDELDQIMMLQMRIEASGFQFISATNGEEGLKKAYEEKPDLILLDLIMPKMDGFEVCRRLKGDPDTKKIPILVITASGGVNVEERCAMAGADGCVRKPYDSAELIKKIKEFIGEP